ncbi:MAG: SDR family NAD(P)-dependent oxidoreductase [Pseudomonadota bacterium]
MTPPLLFDGNGRVALVAGAAGGIGSALVQLLQRGGASVVAFDTTSTTGDISITGDAASEQDVSELFSAAMHKFSRIDWVFNLVGVVGSGALHQQTLEQWNGSLSVNLTPSFLIARAAHASLRASKGSLVLMSSTNGRNGGSHLSGAPYAVAKAGIINMTRYLAKEWAGDGIRVNCIAPGPVDTPMLTRLSEESHKQLLDAIPLHRYASVDEVAATCAFLCSPHAASVTGTCINISGGMLLD